MRNVNRQAWIFFQVVKATRKNDVVVDHKTSQCNRRTKNGHQQKISSDELN